MSTSVVRKVKNRPAKGRRLEHKSRDLLEEQGYYVVRAAGSKGAWDLVGLGTKDGCFDIVLVQVKANKEPPKLKDLSPYPQHWELIYHVWKDYARRPWIVDARSGVKRQ